MDRRRRGSRVFGSLATLAIIIAVVNIGESVENATTTSFAVNDAIVGNGNEMEARSEEISLPMERKSSSSNGGPFARGKDSYLEALRHSRTSTDPREGVVAVDGVGSGVTGSLERRKEQGPVYPAKRSESSRVVYSGSIDRDSYSMVPSDSYTLPTKSAGDFGGIRGSYGAPQPQPQPQPTYGAPYDEYSSYGDYGGTVGAYSPPQQAYGSPAPAYGANHGPHGNPYGATESVHLGFPSIGLSWPFGLKLNAFALAKILLKLVIFKMIVKFIAVICLLLFIPKLEIKKIKKGNAQSNNDEEEEDESDDDGRRSLNATSRTWNRLNLLTAMVEEALYQHRMEEETRRNRVEDCATLPCEIRRAFERERSWPDYEQLLRNYVAEETRIVRAKS